MSFTRVFGLLVLFSLLLPVARADPKYDKRVKGAQKMPGFLTIHRNKDVIHAEVKPGDLNRPFLLAISMSRGPWAGILWNELLVRWELQGKQLLLVEPAVGYSAKNGTPLSRSVERTFTESILRAVPIVGRGPSGSYLVDLSSIFKSDLAQLGRTFGRLKVPLSRWATAKSFPENSELAVDLAYQRGERAQRMRVHYSLRKLPQTGYKPRLADDRVGYFLTVVRDYGRPHNDTSAFSRYLQRWHLEKADPKLKLSPPKKPIVWHIEKTVPYRFRRYVREGILEWNKAFERIGLVNAIVVRQQIAGGDFDDLDPEDARYNFFRWGTANVGYAFGPSRTNPLTGEILDADIYFDDGVLRSNLTYYRKMDVLSRARATDPKLHELLKRDPRWLKLLGAKTSSARPAIPPQAHQGQACMHAWGKAHHLALASLILSKASVGKLPEGFLGQALKETVMHEVGHTLGLRHNFKASSWRPIGDMTGKRATRIISASVMDYNGINFRLKKEEAENYQMSTLGPYDYWAILYGYIPATGAAEKKLLASIAAQSSTKAYAYGTDEDRSFLDPDPMTTAWDLGDDHIQLARRTMALVEKLSSSLIERSVAQGASYYHARRAFDTLLVEYSYVCRLVARYVGGASVNRNHRGDPKEAPPVVPIPGARQREALVFLARTVFSDKAFSLSPGLLNKLAAGRWRHNRSDGFDEQINLSLPDQIRRMQARVLLQLFNPAVLRRVESAPLRSKDKPLSMAELFDTVSGAVWSELDVPMDKPLGVSLVRRNLQRTFVDLLTNLALGGARTDAQTLATSSLRALRKRLRGSRVGHKQIDKMTAAHLEETEERITRVLQAAYQRRR